MVERTVSPVTTTTRLRYTRCIYTLLRFGAARIRRQLIPHTTFTHIPPFSPNTCRTFPQDRDVVTFGDLTCSRLRTPCAYNATTTGGDVLLETTTHHHITGLPPTVAKTPAIRTDAPSPAISTPLFVGSAHVWNTTPGITFLDHS